jgi:hypothetical protein
MLPRSATTTVVRLLSLVFPLAIGGSASAAPGRVVVLTGDCMTIADIVDIAEAEATIAVSADAMARIRLARGGALAPSAI